MVNAFRPSTFTGSIPQQPNLTGQLPFSRGNTSLSPLGGGFGVPQTLDQDIFSDLLEENPQAAFSSFTNQLNNPQQRFFGGRFDKIRNEFLGLLGGQLRQGELPTQRFTDFLGNLDFNRRFRSTAPSLRGQGNTARFAPPTQFRF